MIKTAVILFNLGGPDQQTSVKPFLFNLFHDRAIIDLPQPLRFLIAKLISSRRDKVARAIYSKIGGGSPILKNTQNQAEALEKALKSADPLQEFKTFVVMRYWHPFAEEAAKSIKTFAPDQIILLPLYPQFSTTTTGSSIKDWSEAARAENLNMPTKIVCCYPEEQGFIKALAKSTHEAYDQASAYGKPRILFSAHGLPEKIIQKGDPYQSQCIATVRALRRELGFECDSVLCFQSRVGPLQWIKPATDDEVKRAGKDKVPIVIVPIAFVSDHSETLVELDIEYRHLAKENGVPFYAFVPAVGTASSFIDGLTELTLNALRQTKTCISSEGKRICAPQFSGCAMNEGRELNQFEGSKT